MDYLGIVLDGYFNESSKVNLEAYFYVEFKKAQKEHYTSIMFSTGCYGVIKSFENHLKDKVQDEKRQLYAVLAEAQKGNVINSTDLDNDGMIEQIKQELAEVNIANYNIHLHSLTNGRYAYNLDYLEFGIIAKAMQSAFKRVENEALQESLPPATPQVVEVKKAEVVYQSFSELFKEPKFEAEALKALRTFKDNKEKSIINEANQWIGSYKQKNAIVTWIEVLGQREKIKTINHKHLSELLGLYFTDFSISESLFRKINNTYLTDFQRLIK